MENKEEKVLVVKRELLEPFIKDKPNNVIVGDDAVSILNTIEEHAFFMDRWNGLEEDPTYKQIIPYVVVTNAEFIFLLKRLNTQGEVRLHDKLSIGVGGHINPCDILPGKSLIESGMIRELAEEINFGKVKSARPLGVINNDTSDVSKVHLGILFSLESEDGNVDVNETDKMEGQWTYKQEIQESYDRLESWSQLAFDLIK